MINLLLAICFVWPGAYHTAGFHPKSTYADFLQDEIFDNWLSTSGAGDYNGDGICNMKDYAIVTSDYSYYKAWCTVKFGVIWGTL